MLSPVALAFALAQAVPPVAPVQAPAGSALRDPLPEPTPLPPPAGPVLPFADALGQAAAQAPDLGVARERVVQAENDVLRAWAQIKPTLSATAQYAYNSVESVAFTQTGVSPLGHSSELASLNFAWSFFNLRALPALATARQLVEVSRFSETQARRELLLSVANAYYSAVTLRELAAVAARQARADFDHAREAQARYQAGTVQLSAALRARIDAIRADQETRRALFSYAAGRSQLAALLDRHDTAFEVAEPPAPPPEVRGALAQLLEKAFAERPEMAAARANEEIAARLRTDAWLQFAPTIALNANGRYANPAQSYTGTNSTWVVSLALTLPLYDGGLRYVALKDAASQIRQARDQTRSQAARIEDEVRRAQIDLDSARALLAQAEAALLAARENERLVRAQFSAGTSSQVEVSDAEAALFQSESTAVQQRLSVQLAAVRLAKAVGAFDVPAAPARQPSMEENR